MFTSVIVQNKSVFEMGASFARSNKARAVTGSITDIFLSLSFSLCLAVFFKKFFMDV